MKKAVALALAGAALAAALASAQGRMARSLDMYLIDVEGGNATLFVTPSGESLLIDTGNGGPAAVRDADRIMAAITNAGVREIDHLITTHYHGDHFGAMAELAGRIPIRNFIDHGPNVQPSPGTDAFLDTVYPALYAKGRHTVVRPGDRFAMGDVNVRVVASAGQVMTTPLAGAGRPNPHCASFVPQAADPTENAQSVGVHLAFGRFRVVHLGDLTVNKEFDLMCPANRLGEVDLFVVSHHGQPTSNSEVLVHAIQPRVAVLNNGTRKGGQPETMRVLFSAPRMEDLWQLHFSLLSGQEHTVPGMFIANLTDDQPAAMPVAPLAAPAPGPGAAPPPVHDGPAFWIKVTAREDGSFPVVNGRNGFAKTYAAQLLSR